MDNGVQVVREANARTVAFHNAQADDFMNILSVPVLQPKIHYTQPGGGALQPMDEDGNPLPTITIDGYDVAFPIRGGGDAMGTNRVSRAMMTVEDANDAAQEARVKDKNFLVNHMIAALLTNTAYQFLDKTRRAYVGAGELTVMPLANGDSTRYITSYGRNSTTDNHYLRLPLIDAANNPFPTIYRELKEHTDGSDAVVDVYVADDQVAAIQGLPGFVGRTDSDVLIGANANQLRATANKGIGDEVIGKVSRCWIISMARLPNGYMFAHVRDRKPLGQRQYPVASLQGLFNEEHNVEGNHMETRWLRFTGFGVRDRTSAVAVLIAAAGNYVPPAEYTAPLAIG